MDRHSLLDDDATPTNEQANIFGDEFEADYFDGVADGFRPNVDREGGDAGARQDDVYEPPSRTISAHYATSPVSPLLSHGPLRDSVRKQRNFAANPFASPEDEQDVPETRPQSLEFERDDSIAQRSVSSASSHVYAGTNSPRFGAGPSHPYGAYQQGVARTLSVGTSSTATTRPDPRRSYSRSRPQHPYALYSQGVDDDLDQDDETIPMQANPIPVGFPGLGQNYTRRLGPDGEDQDIIGEDGHIEQLPPYTRYPEEGPEKMPLLPPSLHSRAPVAGTDPTMPLMHTALNPIPTSQPPQSMMDDSLIDRRASRASTNPFVSSSQSTLVAKAEQDGQNVSWKEKKGSAKWKHRVCCGIPVWCLALALVVITFIGAVLGGVLGGFVAGGNHARNKAGAVTVVTSLYDASIIATPTSGAPPTGTYALTLGPPQETQSECLPNPSQQVAWDCDLSPNDNLAISVFPPQGGNGSGANIFYASNDTSIAYGSQMSFMNTPFAQFLTVQDNDNKSNGPAYYFSSFYDKVVVVPENAITTAPPSRAKGKRQTPPNGWIVPEQWRQRKQVATPGERPWFCIWNGTFLEAFIYVHQPAATSSSSSVASTTTSNTSMQTSLPPSGPLTGIATQTMTPPPNNVITTTITAPFTTATYTGEASAFNPWASAQMHQAQDRHQEGDNQYPKRGQAFDAADPWSQMATFPFQVKLEERRLPGNPLPPYCQQYQILDTGHANWVPDGSGNPIIVQLTEQDPNFGAYQSAGVGSVSKRTVPGSCHCQWMSGTVE